ncbi:MAG: hypothetical protein [Bacteroides phage LoVEphage]|nr:MAG: hypothetical protein [Bacteroides phage LoVEphage]
MIRSFYLLFYITKVRIIFVIQNKMYFYFLRNCSVFAFINIYIIH